MLGQGSLLTERGLQRYYIWKKRQAEAQAQIWDDSNGYYFCNIVTVLPGQQGKGIGKMLFREVTERADREGRKCYLESSRNEPNTRIYERLGFRKVKEMDCDDAGAVCKVCMFSFILFGQITNGGTALLHDTRSAASCLWTIRGVIGIICITEAPLHEE